MSEKLEKDTIEMVPKVTFLEKASDNWEEYRKVYITLIISIVIIVLIGGLIYVHNGSNPVVSNAKQELKVAKQETATAKQETSVAKQEATIANAQVAAATAPAAPPDMQVGNLTVVGKITTPEIVAEKKVTTPKIKVTEKIKTPKIVVEKEITTPKVVADVLETKKATTDLFEIERSHTKLSDVDNEHVIKSTVDEQHVVYQHVDKSEVDYMHVKKAEVDDMHVKNMDVDKTHVKGSMKKTEPLISMDKSKSSACDRKGGCYGKVLTGSYQTLAPYKGIRVVSNTNNPRYPENSITFKIEYHRDGHTGWPYGTGWGPTIVLRNATVENPIQLVDANANLILSYLESTVALKKGKSGNEGDSCWEVAILRDGAVYKNESPAEAPFHRK